jgi:hypothetical protein
MIFTSIERMYNLRGNRARPLQTQAHALVGRFIYYSLPSFYVDRLHLFALVIVMYCFAFCWIQCQALIFERFLSPKVDFETIYSTPTTVCHQEVQKKCLELKNKWEREHQSPWWPTLNTKQYQSGGYH